jgi:hypothetical protein
VTEERGRALNNKEPESETVYACRIHAIKRAEDVCQLGGWNANAAIAHFEVHSRASPAGGYEYATPAWRIVDRVADQVAQYAVQQHRIA